MTGVGQGGGRVGPLQALAQEALACKQAEWAAAKAAVLEQCDPHWRDVVQWGIEEYERQLQVARGRS